MLTVGPLAENCFLVRRDGGDRALLIDPGEEADRLLGVLSELGVELEAILLTHTHFDHVGAVAPIARATGAPVYCPVIEKPILQDINAYMRMPGFGPFESHDPEHTVSGDPVEQLTLAGLDIEVLFTPGHSPGHVTYAISEDGGAPLLFSGDVLFEGSVGRTDLPGGDHGRLLQSIAMLLAQFDDTTPVHPGHMGVTTLGRERATNPFLAELARR
jgi:hydroxyacylglutathione hydrolase